MTFSLANLDTQQATAMNDEAIGADNLRLDAQVADSDKVAELARLSLSEYDRAREAAAEQLGIRLTTLDKQVERTRKAGDPNAAQGSELTLPEPEPWPEPVDGAELLSDMVAAIRRYMFMPEHSTNAAALWAVHTFIVDGFTHSPRLAIRSPEKMCGKSTLLDILELLTWRPLLTPSITGAGLFRVVEAWRPTLLLDEQDNTFGGEDGSYRAILNQGHRAKGGYAIRCDGDDNTPRKFNVFGAVALALIGELPDTLGSRCIKIDLQRAKSGELPTAFRSDRAPELEILARMARRWAEDNRRRIASAEPHTGNLFNRDADNWRPLYAIADIAGGPWPELARSAAAAASRPVDEQSTRTMLLSDIRDIFEDDGGDRISSALLVESLVAIEGRPWAEWGRSGKPMSANGLARQLAKFKIGPRAVRDGAVVFKGYLKTGLHPVPKTPS